MDAIRAEPSTLLPFGMVKATLAPRIGEMWKDLYRCTVNDWRQPFRLILDRCSRRAALSGICGRPVDDLRVPMYESNQPSRSYNRFF
jgi:hypothetical protein